MRKTLNAAVLSSILASAGFAAVATSTNSASAATEQTIKAYTTGYSAKDNTPRNSTDISHPSVHKQAGGTGTYADPITLAVGHIFDKAGNDILDYAPGTKFYNPSIQKYMVVEDTCGDGDDGSINGCHVGYTENGVKYPWVDIWVDGRTTTDAKTEACMDKITDVHTLIMNPAADYKVTTGALADSGCATFGETPIKVSGSTTPVTPAPTSTTVPTVPSTSTTKTFTANADTYVDSGAANTNYGKTMAMGVDAAPTIKRTYMSFPVSGVSGKTVTSAKLRFYVTDASAHEQNFVKTSGSWSETGTTWNNRPGTVSTPSASRYGLKVGWNEVSIPVSDITGDGTYNYGVHPHDSGDTDGLDIASRESGNAMQLIVTTK